MRRLRGPSVPGFLLTLVFGLALLLSGVGHSLAHSHAAEHHHSETAPQQHDGSYGTLTGEHHGDGHSHLDLVATPSPRPSLAHAVVVPAVVLALDALGEERPLPPAATAGLPPGNRNDGPPPPSRAPPLV